MLRAPAILACALLAACASDAAPEPEAPLETPGAFVAVQEQDGRFTLLRTLDRLKTQNAETLIFQTVYDVTPLDFDDARELSKRHDLPIRFEAILASEKAFHDGRPWSVVWFRTLTDAEKARVH